MSKSDWGVVVVAACVAFWATTGLILSLPSAVATEEKAEEQYVLGTPQTTLLVDGVRLSLEVGKVDPSKPDAKLALTLIAENTTSESKSIEAEVRIEEQKVELVSRVALPVENTNVAVSQTGNTQTQAPRVMKESITLDSGEKRRIELHPDVTVNFLQGMTSLIIASGDESVVAATLPTVLVTQ